MEVNMNTTVRRMTIRDLGGAVASDPCIWRQCLSLLPLSESQSRCYSLWLQAPPSLFSRLSRQFLSSSVPLIRILQCICSFSDNVATIVSSMFRNRQNGLLLELARSLYLCLEIVNAWSLDCRLFTLGLFIKSSFMKICCWNNARSFHFLMKLIQNFTRLGHRSGEWEQ